MADALRKHHLGLRVWLRLQGENKNPLYFDHPLGVKVQITDTEVLSVIDIDGDWLAAYERDAVLMVQPIEAKPNA